LIYLLYTSTHIPNHPNIIKRNIIIEDEMARGRNSGKAIGTLGTILILGAATAYFLWQNSQPVPVNQSTSIPYSTSAPYATEASPSQPAETLYTSPTLESPSPLETAVENSSEELLLGSFNIQILGQSKANKTAVMDALGQIVSQYDIVAIQELREDASADEIGACSGVALTTLLDRIRNETGKDFGCIQGDKQGRSNSKEQYVFIFNPDVVQPVGQYGGAYTYNDTEDIFAREPLVAQFRAGNFDFALANIHTDPDDARAEICALNEVIEDAQSHYHNDDDVIVLGDYNADGGYFNENTSECFKASPYSWIIGNSIDTTVAKESLTYDRMVFKHQFGDEDFTGESGAFYYNQSQNGTPFKTVAIDPGTELKTISDHYPIWAIFYTNKDTD
jgi:deoxyribonuclease-1-like protein